ncbi:MAG: DUF4367 domain-containing protein [Lachnospiraceae bacterium]|nr:DUF4367 domain-containing protein [Lachnospiraceae bacterium]
MNKKQNDKDNDFLQSVKNELYVETFEKDVPDYSYERVETLVKMIELEEGSEEEDREAAEAQAAFEKKFREIASGNRKEKRRKRAGKVLRTVAAMLFMVLLADITSEAFMDESLFHVINRWTNQFTIRPGMDKETENIGFEKDQSLIFTRVEDFADYFDDDFLVCSWLPEGVRLKEISRVVSQNYNNYMWNYCNEYGEKVIGIRMYEKVSNDIAGLTGTQIEKGDDIQLKNGMNATVYANNDEYLVAFEYEGWWYLIHSLEKKNIIIKLLEGMIEYE